MVQLTSTDIRHRSFLSAFRGYAREEVDNFIEQIALSFDELLHERELLTKKIDNLTTSLARYEEIEKTLQDMLINGQRTAEAAKVQAEREAAIIIREANFQAENIQKESEKELEEIKKSIVVLREQKKSFLIKFRTLIKSQIEMLQLFEAGEVSAMKRLKPEELSVDEGKRPA